MFSFLQAPRENDFGLETGGNCLGSLSVSRSYDAPCLTKITLDNWRYFGQLEVLSRTVGTPEK